MAEFLDVLTEEGYKTEISRPRNEIHSKGEWHASVHVWLRIFDTWILQKRNFLKESFPGFYDCSSSGHVDAGENPEMAAYRELQEELGIELKSESLAFVGRQKLIYVSEDKSFVSNEINYIFIGSISEEDYKKIVIDTSEVESICCMPLSEIKDKRSSGQIDCCFSDYEISLLDNYQL